MASSELEIRDWELTDSFVSAVVKQLKPTTTDYIEGVGVALADAIQQYAPEKTGELRSSVQVEVVSPMRVRILMSYYAVWVDRGHRVVMRTRNRYRIQQDRGRQGKTAMFLWRTRPANFIRQSRQSQPVQDAINNTELLFRRRQSN